MKKVILSALISIAAVSAQANTYCNAYIKREEKSSRFDNAKQSPHYSRLTDALQSHGYVVVNDKTEARVIVTFKSYCYIGSNEGCDVAAAHVTLMDTQTKEQATFNGQDEGVFFNASQSSAMRMAIQNIPDCEGPL